MKKPYSPKATLVAKGFFPMSTLFPYSLKNKGIRERYLHTLATKGTLENKGFGFNIIIQHIIIGNFKY